ncbi:parathyroid hormone/parathyroid hormone-related peptide receptor-like isoform X2 [Biomphalaria glabrata]|uniref:Parathyroid hormone/parathyroid hormone-related peptide receptor-like isoform X2 n=1 Tax=Biomphalaria glabrata TaxID=6526 RepID=A0A9W3A2R3_BIOGL|nr:parathyroid hormone/parathyroid hormone-related peptide receptor-like isoform X2 [Biomphalaria glabrata]
MGPSKWNTSKKFVSVHEDEQLRLIEDARVKCYQEMDMAEESTAAGSVPYCNMTWDGIACWPSTMAGKTVELPCPNYINNFYIEAYATKTCMQNGEWFHHSEFNVTWSNYSSCRATENSSVHEGVSEVHVNRIQTMYSLGYGISLIALTVAIFIMIYFRRLHCPRNTIHLNLFMAFVLRALLSFLKDNLHVIHIELFQEIEEFAPGRYRYQSPSGSHWQCKILFTTFHYVQLTSSAWVFIEGFYLYILVTVTIFSERRYIRWCTLLGWAGPLLFLVPWVIIRATIEDDLCWNTHPTTGYFWILKCPQVAIVVINFVFFINIVRVLFTKLVRTAPPRARKYRYRRLGKSTLVLIPIFGVHYLVTIGVPDNIDPVLETIKLYLEMFFNSFQGLLIACLFCFMNGEVQTEIRKRYIRHKLRVNSRKFHNKYATTASSHVRPRTCPSCSPRHESREVNSSSGSDHNQSLERQKLRIYIQPMRYYRAQPPVSSPIDVRPIIYTSKKNSYV